MIKSTRHVQELLQQLVEIDIFFLSVATFTARALAEYTRTRNKDVEAMCDLAMYNYIEVSKTGSL